ncbi:hypothetical protein SUGI_0678810 [Cryptomeria japonica]|nr:hypothetical protein SUGI_0678810 [Cryptomeria japonica]
MLGFALPAEMGKRKIVSCAPYRLQRKKCSNECILAPHFPPNDPDKFTVVQKVFGASYIIKLLQGLETKQRAEAVNNLVCEASARLKDPIHGSGGEVHELQKRISELESQLAAKEEELMNMRSMYEKLVFPLSIGSHDVQDAVYHDTSKDSLYGELDSLFSEPMGV